MAPILPGVILLNVIITPVIIMINIQVFTSERNSDDIFFANSIRFAEVFLLARFITNNQNKLPPTHIVADTRWAHLMNMWKTSVISNQFSILRIGLIISMISSFDIMPCHDLIIFPLLSMNNVVGNKVTS